MKIQVPQSSGCEASENSHDLDYSFQILGSASRHINQPLSPWVLVMYCSKAMEKYIDDQIS